MLDSAYAGVVIIGLLHGLEPGHGWPVAFLYSIRRNRPMYYGLISSSLISLFHFISSLAVVAVYASLASLLNISASFMNYVAAVFLLILAYRLYREKVEDEFEAQHGHLHRNKREIEHIHEHEHPGQGRHIHQHKHAKSIALSLYGIATFAFVLGFAHEEEFALLALAVGGVNPLILMVSYAATVTSALIGVTLTCIKTYGTLLTKIRCYQKHVPKISAISLLIMAIAFILGLI
jgi:ABC-type nickel/cobalt efflux system permease component RcnA